MTMKQKQKDFTKGSFTPSEDKDIEVFLDRLDYERDYRRAMPYGYGENRKKLKAKAKSR